MTAPPARTGHRSLASPELVALLILGGLTVPLVSGLIRFADAGPAAPSPHPGGSAMAASSFVPTPSSSLPVAVDSSALAAVLVVDGNLERQRDALVAELSSSTFDTLPVASAMRQTNAQLRLGLDLARRLAAGPPTARLASDLTDLYTDVSDETATALAHSLQDQKAYRLAASAIVERLTALPDLDARASRLLETGFDPTMASPAPTASAVPSPSAAPSAAATSVPSAWPSPSASLPASPPASPTGPPNLLADPGFEDPAEAAWPLVVSDPAASATLIADPTGPAAGRLSARIDITVTSASRSGIALGQDRLRIDSGTRYTCSILGRASGAREIRVRIAGAAGDTYGTRLFTVGTEWQLLSFDFVSLVSDLDASFEVDLGRASATTWLDEASMRAVEPNQVP